METITKQPNDKFLINNGEKTFEWSIPTGPIKFSRVELDSISNQLIGFSDETLLISNSNRFLKPYVSGKTESKENPRIIIHSATDGINAYDTDYKQMLNNLTPYGFDTFFNQRSLALAKDGDMQIGRTKMWKETAGSKPNVLTVDIESEDVYQTSHALLDLATKNSNLLNPIIDKLTFEPNSLVNLYTLDKENQVFLLWLLKKVNDNRKHYNMEPLPNLFIEANSPEITENWNQKGIFYPSVLKVGEVDLPKTIEKLPHKILEFEDQFSQLGETLGISIPRLPGYKIDYSDIFSDFCGQFLKSASLLSKRYGLEKGVIKLVRSTDGANIFTNIDLKDENKIKEIAEEIQNKKDDFVFEAHVNYEEFNGIEGEKIQLSPSSHIIEGKPTNMVTLQFTRDGEWRGNISINPNDDSSKDSMLGLNKQQIDSILTTMNKFSNSSNNLDLGLSVGGFDFAVGKIGGKFGNEILVAPQDPNLRFFGAMFMYKFMENAKQILKRDDIQVATRLIDPPPNLTFSDLKKFASEISTPDKLYDVIALVPPRFGMIAVTGKNSIDAAKNVLKFEKIIAKL